MSIAVERTSVSPEWLLERVSDRSAHGLASTLEQLIRSGQLAPGVQLPTVRQLASTGGTSVGTILSAWSTLRDGGYIQTQRRGGTIVLDTSPASATSAFAGWSSVDLGQSAPDIRLQPSLAEALMSSLDGETLNVFGREYMTARLRDALAPDWPFEPQAWATAGGGTEALLLAIEAAAPPGSTVAVDEPVGPGLLDTLHDLGIRAVGVPADDDGPMPIALEQALADGAVAFVFQPGAPFGMRHRVTTTRVGELAAVLADHPDVWVVEDDSIGPLEDSPSPSFGASLPDRVLRIRSFCKAYGIDVRTSVLAGAAELVDRTIGLRSHGVGSNSRILQNTLAHLIRSPDAARTVEVARGRYTARRAALLAALDRHGVIARSGPHSLVVWAEVADETAALLALARQGILAGAASRSFATSPEHPLLRLSITQLPDDEALIDELAGLIAAAARGGAREFFD